jgi:hypothetical protein
MKVLCISKCTDKKFFYFHLIKIIASGTHVCCLVFISTAIVFMDYFCDLINCSKAFR